MCVCVCHVCVRTCVTCHDSKYQAIEDRLSKEMVHVVLSQDLEEVQKAERPRGGGRRASGYTPKHLIHEICEEENGVVGGILDIPLDFIAASSTAITTGLLLWKKNRVLLIALILWSSASFRMVLYVRWARDWFGNLLGVNVNDKYVATPLIVPLPRGCVFGLVLVLLLVLSS